MEQNKKRRIFGLIVLLAIIGGIGVWAYSNHKESDSPNNLILNQPSSPVQQIQQPAQPKQTKSVVSSTKCGDHICGANEMINGKVYCEKDCIPQCGNGICEDNEDYRNCGDCEEYVVDICGNGVCEPEAENPETLSTCPSDCQV